MRYLLLLALALGLTIAWQTSVVADNPPPAPPRCSATTVPTDGEAALPRDEEPDCD